MMIVLSWTAEFAQMWSRSFQAGARGRMAFQAAQDCARQRRRTSRPATWTPSRRAQGHRVAGTVLGDRAKTRPWKMSAADQHPVSNHPLDQLPAADLGKRRILVEYAVPARVRSTQRRHIDG